MYVLSITLSTLITLMAKKELDVRALDYPEYPEYPNYPNG